MVKVMTATISICLYLVSTQVLSSQSLDTKINQFFNDATGWFSKAIFAQIPISDDVGIPWVLLVLLLGALYFTIYFKLINITGFRTAVQIVLGKYDRIDNQVVQSDASKTINTESPVGQVTHLQALTTALSATIGLGNIAGVAIALSIGGAGATFWMVLVGLLGMTSKFVECTLGVKYREIARDGTVFGGPMYYLKNGLKTLGFSKIGKIMSIIFAVMCVGGSFGGGNMFQANQAFQLLEHVTGGEQSFFHEKGWLFGVIMAILVGVVIIGGIKKIARVTEKIVPTMVLTYVLAVLVILGINFKAIPTAIIAIFDGAFSPEGVTGGFVGVLIQGFRRAAFSNEAGIGSAAIAHAAVKTNYAASEGLVALLEPFIDTVVVCTMTALVLIITGQITVGSTVTDTEGILLTSNALASGISWFPYVLSIAVILFAFSSMISWSYYGFQAWSFLFGRSKKIGNTYKVIFCLFTVIGSSATLDAVTYFSDAMVFAMMVPNMIGLVVLAPSVLEELKRYKAAIKKV